MMVLISLLGAVLARAAPVLAGQGELLQRARRLVWTPHPVCHGGVGAQPLETLALDHVHIAKGGPQVHQR